MRRGRLREGRKDDEGVRMREGGGRMREGGGKMTVGGQGGC
jgi:hypothetical protein